MSGKAIGKTLSLGFRGNVSRMPDTLIQAYQNVGTDPIQFGEPVVYDVAKKGVRKLVASDVAGALIVGIAVRRMGQPYADAPEGYYYAANDTVDVLVRGSITVEVKSIAGIAAHGKVYVCNGTGSNKAGDIVCATGTDALEIPNAIFATGNFDGNNIAEVTILTRSI